MASRATRFTVSTAAAAMLAAAGAARAESPEVVQGLGPEDGEIQLQYSGQFGDANGSDVGREHSGQSFWGVTDRFAIGGETLLSYRSGPLVEEDRVYFDYDSVIGIVRFGDAAKGPGVGVWLQAGLDADGELARLEARLLVERRTPRWWGMANVMLRRVNEEAQEGAYVAYGGRLSYALAERTWVGLEASGQAFRVAGFDGEPIELAQYAGPGVMQEFSLLGADVQLGVTYLRRLDRDSGLRNVFQVSGELRF